MSADGKKQNHWTFVLFVGIDEATLEAKMSEDTRSAFRPLHRTMQTAGLLRASKTKNHLWFDSTLGGDDANCHHFDFNYTEDFCADL